MHDITQLGHRIKQACAYAEITQQEAAQLAGLNGGTMSKIIRGHSPKPAFETICRIADVTGVSLDFLAARNLRKVKVPMHPEDTA